jgi:hypothetical protein
MSTVRWGTAVFVVVGAGLMLVPDQALAQKKDRNTITREEIENSPQKNQDILQVIRSLRPHFLAPPRGTRSLGFSAAFPTVVYVNGTKAGELDVLKYLMAADVMEVRYLEPAKAIEEFGQDHNGGVVLVKRMEGTKPAVKPPH